MPSIVMESDVPDFHECLAALSNHTKGKSLNYLMDLVAVWMYRYIPVIALRSESNNDTYCISLIALLLFSFKLKLIFPVPMRGKGQRM